MLTIEQIQADIEQKKSYSLTIAPSYHPDVLPWDDITPQMWGSIVCETCCQWLTFCQHRPNRGHNAADWQAIYDRTKPAKTPTVLMDIEGNEIARPAKQNRKGRAKRTIVLTEAALTQATELKNKGLGLVAIAKTINANPGELSVALKEKGVTFKKGRKTL